LYLGNDRKGTSFLNVSIRNPNYKGVNPFITPKDKKQKNTKRQRLLRKEKPSSVLAALKTKAK